MDYAKKLQAAGYTLGRLGWIHSSNLVGIDPTPDGTYDVFFNNSAQPDKEDNWMADTRDYGLSFEDALLRAAEYHKQPLF